MDETFYTQATAFLREFGFPTLACAALGLVLWRAAKWAAGLVSRGIEWGAAAIDHVAAAHEQFLAKTTETQQQVVQLHQQNSRLLRKIARSCEATRDGIELLTRSAGTALPAKGAAKAP